MFKLKKQISFILLCCLVTASLFNSCKKDDEEQKDLATAIVGSYLGDITVNGGVYPGETIVVTKLSDTRIQIAPASGGNASAFAADLTETGDGVLFNIPTQGVITGKAINGNASVHGSFVSSTKQISYSITVSLGTTSTDEAYIGIRH